MPGYSLPPKKYVPKRYVVGADAPTTPATAPSGAFNWLTAANVFDYARLVDAEFDATNADIFAYATANMANWNLQTGTAWFTLYNNWKAEYTEISDWADSLLSFGSGGKWDTVSNYQAQLKTWQDKIQALTSKPPTVPVAPYVATTDGTLVQTLESETTPIAIGLGVGAVGALLLYLLVKR